MTEKSTENMHARAISQAVSRWRVSASPFSALPPSTRVRSVYVVLAVWLFLGGLGPGVLQAKPKTDKFEGTVVVVGPKAITVKSRYNTYMVRTFHYSAELEQKILRKRPEAGKKVTVHYVRGSDLALKVDD
jgi:hypothetical protein